MESMLGWLSGACTFLERSHEIMLAASHNSHSYIGDLLVASRTDLILWLSALQHPLVFYDWRVHHILQGVDVTSIRGNNEIYLSC